ncbi:MAG: YraN family protein, partial [Hyphomonadaceae bacterium]
MSARDAAGRRKAEQRGRSAELIAMLWLMLKGYRILGRRVRTPHGEIDLAALKDRTLIIVEVKARKTKLAGGEALMPRQQQRLANAALLLAKRWRLTILRMRFDLMIVGAQTLPIHVRGAWFDDR